MASVMGESLFPFPGDFLTIGACTAGSRVGAATCVWAGVTVDVTTGGVGSLAGGFWFSILFSRSAIISWMR